MAQHQKRLRSVKSSVSARDLALADLSINLTVSIK